jgi:NADH-quinone oxidoreductase subunit L
MARSFIMTFLGSYRGEQKAHEAPLVMSVPVLILAVLSLVGGLYLDEHLVEYLQGPLPAQVIHNTDKLSAEGALFGSLPGLVGISLALWMFVVVISFKDRLRQMFWPLERLFAGKYYVDELLDSAVVAPVNALANVSYRSIDQGIVEGSGSGLASVSRAVGELVRRMTTGQVATYLLMMFVAVSLLFVVFVQAR